MTSPPYFSLRAYQDGGEVYDGQIGSEDTPQEYLEALWAWTAECRRVLKPSGSMFAHLAATARAQAASALHTAGDPGQAVLEARMSAQQAGWAIRRNHGGRDLCAAHRIEAAA